MTDVLSQAHVQKKMDKPYVPSGVGQLTIYGRGRDKEGVFNNASNNHSSLREKVAYCKGDSIYSIFRL